MRDQRHTKFRYEANVDLEEFAVFYDFTEANQEFLGLPHKEKKQSSKRNSGTEDYVVVDGGNAKVDDDDDDQWEDIDDDEEENNMDVDEDDEDDDSLYDAYEEAVSRLGWDVTPLGELVFPDGRIIGHRALRKYYQQRARPVQNSTAVVAARQAAGERLYRGRVYSTFDPSSDGSGTNALVHKQALILKQAGVSSGAVPTGRAGRGLLVTNSAGHYTQLSVYRYRAAVLKQRRDDVKGKRLYERSMVNTNRMDKKANRLMNNVSVAHAPR
jgi:pre-60S factor REI1